MAEKEEIKNDKAETKVAKTALKTDTKRTYTKKTKKRGRPVIVKRGRPAKTAKEKAPYTKKADAETLTPIEENKATEIKDKIALSDEAKNNDALCETENTKVENSIDLAYINVTKPTVCLAGALSYVVFFLCFIVCKQEKFVRYHANQSVVLLLFTIFAAILCVGLYYIYIPVCLVVALIFIVFCFTLLVMGISNAVNGICKPLPLIGKITIIKQK